MSSDKLSKLFVKPASAFKTTIGVFLELLYSKVMVVYICFDDGFRALCAVVAHLVAQDSPEGGKVFPSMRTWRCRRAQEGPGVM